MADLGALLVKIDPSLPTLSHEIAVMPSVLGAYADAAPDLTSTLRNATQLSDTIVDRRDDLDALLISAIGLADIGNDVVATNSESLTNVMHLLVPTTTLTNQYNPALTCALKGVEPLALGAPPAVAGGVMLLDSFLLGGTERYRYPKNLPKVAATGGPQCMDLPNVGFGQRPPFVVTDIDANPAQYGNQGILLNSDALKQALFGPPGRSAPPQHRPDRTTRMTGRYGTAIKFGVFGVTMALLTGALFVIMGQFRTGSTNGYTAVFTDASSLRAGDSVRVAGVRIGTVDDVALQPDNTVLVSFDADRNVVLTTATKVAVRYLDLVGNRYLELLDSPPGRPDPTAGLADSPRAHRAGPRSRSAAGRAQTCHSGTQRPERQRLDQLAHPDPSGPGRHRGIAALTYLVVHPDPCRQRPGGATADRQPAHRDGHGGERR